MSTRLLLTAGSVLRGDDAAGPYLARMLEDNPIDGWTVIDGAQTPEDDIPVVRKIQPDLTVLVDAAAMGLAPGSIRLLKKEDVFTDYLMTTHSLPMTMLLESLEQCSNKVLFIGIQAGQNDLLAPLSPEVLQAVETLYQWLLDDVDLEQVIPTR